VLPAIGVLQIPTKTKRANHPVKLAQVLASKQISTASEVLLATKRTTHVARKENILPQLSPNVPIVP
tara:strand:- start:1382 stop:1582 length:201 start_codon:yes stop_codon:yes gene_type:complete